MIDWTHRSKLVLEGKPAKPIIQPFVFGSSNVAYSRCRIAAAAMEWGADWLLWLDADHSFPENTLTRLLGRGRPIVGVNYRRRMEEVKYTAYAMRDGNLVPATPEGDGIEQVEHMGMGVCLTHAEVFRRISPPYFHFDLREDGAQIGEDVVFFGKVKAAGIPAFVDHALSREVGHMSEVELKL